MDYPPEFSAQSQARVEAARIRAQKELANTGPFTSSERTRMVEGAALHYALSVMKVFAHEACEIGRQGRWAIQRIEAEVSKALLQIAKGTERLCSDLGYRNPKMTAHYPPGLVNRIQLRTTRLITEGWWTVFKTSTEWGEYQDELLAVADLQASNPNLAIPIAIDPNDTTHWPPASVAADNSQSQSKASPVKTAKEPQLDLLKNEDATLNRQRAADALGVSTRTFDRWIGEGKLTPVGTGARKRFRVRDLKRILSQRNLDKRDIK